MNEEMNNNVVNNNYEPPKSNNSVKVLLIVLILLVLCLIGLTCYKMFIYDKEDNGKTNYKKINYEIRKDEYDGDVLYIDNEYIPISESPIDQLTVKNFNDILVLEAKINIGNYIYAIGSDKKLIKFDYNGAEKNELEKIYNYELMKIDGKTLYINGNVTLTQDYPNCDFYKENLDKVSYYTISYEYLGNGKFSEGKIVDKKTVAEVYANELNECENNQNGYEKINYEIKKEKDEEVTYEYLYVNGKKVEDMKYMNNVEVKQFKDILLVGWIGPGPSAGLSAVDNGGNVTNLNKIIKLDKGWTIGSNKYVIDNDIILVKHRIAFSQAFAYPECKTEDMSLLDSYEVKYEYLGNGKFSSGEVVNKKTIEDNYANKCNDFTIFKDIFTEKLCSRNNGKITCYSITGYENIKNKLFELYGENNCKDKKYSNSTVLRCQISDKYCELSNDGYLHCDEER